jgi:hypothetical protein
MIPEPAPPTSSGPAEPSVELVALAAPAPTRRGPSNAQYLLGLFVLWQLFFLCASNFIGLVQGIQESESYIPKSLKKEIERQFPWFLNENSHFNDALKAIDGITDRWAYLSCQPQGWTLFAPNVGHEATFVAVEMRWDNIDPLAAPGVRPAMPYVPEMLLSENEPRDPTHFFRLGKFRLRKYESYLDVSLTCESDTDSEQIADDWSGQIQRCLTKRWANIHAYFLCRFRAFQEKHPRRPMPQQFILHVRRFEIPRPEAYSTAWYSPSSLPIARWKPGDRADESPRLQMQRYVPRAYDVICANNPGFRARFRPELLALLSYWSQPTQPLSFMFAGAYHRAFESGKFVPLD